MGNRRAFVFTNFIFVVQNLLVLLLIWNVSSTAPPPSLSFFPSRQQHSVGRTLLASRPSRGSRTGEAVFASTRTPVDRQNNFSPNFSPFPLSSSLILLKYRKHLADKKNPREVKQLLKDRSSEGTVFLSYLRSPSRSDSFTPLLKHMTVDLKGSTSATTTTVIPLIPLFGALTESEKKPLESVSSPYSLSSTLSERLFRLNATDFKSLSPPPTKITTPTTLSNSTPFTFSSIQNVKTSSFITSNSSSFLSKKHRSSQISLGRTKDAKRSKELISTKEKEGENLNVITPVTVTSDTYYNNHSLYYPNHNNRKERKQNLSSKKGRKKKEKSDKKLSETPSQRHPKAYAQMIINNDSEGLFGYEKHTKTLSGGETSDQQLLRQKSFSNSIIQSLKVKKDFSFVNKIQMQKSHKKVKVKVSHFRVKIISQIQNSSILKRFATPIGLLPLMNAQKWHELPAAVLVPSSSSSSSILLRSLLIQKTTPDLVYSSILRPKTDVDSANHKPKQKIQHVNSYAAIPSITDINEGVELIAKQNENTPDVETEVNDIINGNSKTKSEFMLYQESKNRRKQVVSQHESEHINLTDTFITTRVYSSTLPARSRPAIDNMTTASPLSGINRLLRKATGNFSLPSSKAENHDNISKRHRRDIDENKYLHKPTNTENNKKKRLQKYKQFKNRIEEYQVMHKKNSNSSPPSDKHYQIADSAKPCKDDSKMIKVRKKRSFLSDYEHYIELEERRKIKEMENKKKRLAKGELFNDVSLDEVFAVQSQPEPRKVKSREEDNYEAIDFSPQDSKLSLSTLEFPPADPILLPPVVLTPENPKPLQIFKIASGDTRESSVQRNQAEFGSGDELALSFLIPCSKGEKYYCLNGGTCLIVYTMDVKTCRCPVGYSGQRCEQIDHDYFYSILQDPAYLN